MSKYAEHYDEWVRLYTEEGLNVPQICEIYGCSQRAVYHLLEKRGIPRGLKGHYDEWVRLYEEEGLSTNEIAERFNCDGSHVYRILKKKSADIRSVSEALSGKPRPVSRRSLEERFWEKVNRCGDDECWEWTAATAGGKTAEYGVIAEGNGTGKMMPATHASLILHGQPKPFEGAQVNHHCDNPSCVNPRHLYWGNQEENIHDMIRRGRKATKITFEDAEDIRRRYAAGGITQQELADEFGIAQNHVSSIVRNVVWVVPEYEMRKAA